MHEAKSNLSKLVERAQAGEEVVIARNGEPVAKLVPVERKRNRFGELRGIWKGKMWVADDFDETPQEIIDSFYESKIFPDEDEDEQPKGES